MRLIDADEAKKYLYEHLDDLHMIAAMNAINEMPTIDAQPVKRGRWETVYEHTAIVRIDGIGYETKPKDYVVCSVCGKSSKRADNFCGNCGAKMDGGDADA